MKNYFIDYFLYFNKTLYYISVTKSGVFMKEQKFIIVLAFVMLLYFLSLSFLSYHSYISLYTSDSGIHNYIFLLKYLMLFLSILFSALSFIFILLIIKIIINYLAKL